MELVSINNLSKSFKKKKVIENVNFSIKQGEILGILGPSGSGKSTFIKTLIGFHKPSSGEIIINSEIINTKTKNPLGFSTQENSIYDYLTVKQNLKYFSKIYQIPEKKKRINYLLNKLNLKEFEKTLCKNLSGGTKKRLDIACALIPDPNIIVLDEPFIGLDPALINTISKLILDLNKKRKTIIISSHRVKELSKICTRLIAIKNKKFYSLHKSEIEQVYN
jgi:ABC-2 type transport system ATP-binding protein